MPSLYYGIGYFIGVESPIRYVDTIVVGYEERVGTKNTNSLQSRKTMYRHCYVGHSCVDMWCA